MSRSMNLDGTYVVTGSSSGIGRAIALNIADLGGKVVVHGHSNRQGAAQTVDMITSRGGKAVAVIADITRADQREQLLAGASDFAEGVVRGWVHCAGADVLTGDIAEASFLDKLERLWEVDVKATILLARDVGERMLAAQLQNGNPAPADEQAPDYSMVFIGWDQASEGMEGDAGQMFGTVKGAVMSYALALAQTLAPHVRVNCVAPGWIRTKWGDDASAYWSARATANALMGRWGTPEDVAAAVGYLLGKPASFVTGQILPVNGGWNRRFLSRQ